ncbi:MAG: hypothetical protein HQL21_09690 [Candidatus Omnitrophica bacterium]|nr:hypothetical protein [Candidatus Omnitrophota bacterium]
MRMSDGDKLKSYLEEWQTSALVSYDLKHFTPYTGLRYSGTGYVMWSRVDKHTGIKSPADKRLGLIAGVDIPLASRVWVTAEADGAGQDDVGLTAAIHCRF